MYNSKGTLTVRTYTAGGALPIENAVVRIIGANEENRFFARSLLTDEDGLTEKVSLPAPSIDYSLSPSPSSAPSASYNVEISHPGYYTKRIDGVSVFSGIDSIQLVNMIPADGNPNDYPRGSLNTTIPQNEDL